tara:strand:+ start:741 stop:1145 length:405 start_codon:yes stop_codon:yes gene_type:complete
MKNNTPTEVKLRKRSNILELIYSDGNYLEFSSEFLRVHSPSAEVRGHRKGQEVLQTGKLNVKLKSVAPVGNYALKLEFDDGHNTGIFSWDYLVSLGRDKKTLWHDYLLKLEKAGKTRDPAASDSQIIEIKPLKN